MIIKNNDQGVVAIISLLNNSLHGRCEWFDGRGKILSSGYFENGEPFAGTILNWSKVFIELEEKPFERDYYCKDWITIYETMYLSEEPDYRNLVEAYYRGERI